MSVIIPVYNGTNYLAEAVESVFAQTYPHIELIVVDDGSTDETWSLIQSYGARLTGLKKLNGGVASALNLGIQNAAGKYIAWLSHDDIFLPDKIERQVAYLQSCPQFQGCYTDFWVTDAQGDVLRLECTPWYPRQQAVRALFGHMFINGSTTLIEKQCFEMTGLFEERFRHTQDVDLWMRFLEQFEFGRLAEPLLKSRSHPAQDSWKHQLQLTEEQSVYLQAFERLLFAQQAADQTASEYEWLGDTMLRSRKWYQFARQQYQKSSSLLPGPRNPAFWKNLAAAALVALVGRETVEMVGVKMGRYFLNQGDSAQARGLFAQVWRARPLRIDALAWWLFSWLDARTWLKLRQVKQKLGRARAHL